MRPRLLNRLIKPTRPPAAATIAAFCTSVSAAAACRPSNLGPNTSCSIGLAMAITAMPAVTFVQSTAQINQNWGVFNA